MTLSPNSNFHGYSKKWNTYPKDVLPLWVAGIDFHAPVGLLKAFSTYLETRKFDYSVAPPEVKESIKSWISKKYGVETRLEDIFPLKGLVASSHFVLNSLLEKEEDKYLVFTPIYPPLVHFSQSLKREVVEEPLVLTKGRYEIDFARLEKTLKENAGKIKVILFCNPHNPVGTVWKKEELQLLMDLAKKYDFVVLSDEIWSDLTLYNNSFYSITNFIDTFPDRVAAFFSTAKSFAIPAFSLSYLVTKATKISENINLAANFVLTHASPLDYIALQHVYAKEEKWLVDLQNKFMARAEFALNFLKEKLPMIEVLPPASTHLLWLDCSKLPQISKEESAYKFFLKKAKVALSAGENFSFNNKIAFKQFARLNFACEEDILAQALERMYQALLKA